MFSRRAGVGDARRAGFRGIGMRQALLNLAAGGVFTRSTEGSYLIMAPNNGATAFLAWAGVDTRRVEDRGDGLGPMLFMEGSRTNTVGAPRDNTDPWWTGAGTATRTGAQPNSPDATSTATRIQAALNQYANFRAGLSVGVNGVFSQYNKTINASATGAQLGGAAAHLWADTGGIWRRDDGFDGTNGTYAPVWYVAPVSSNIDCHIDLMQFEVGATVKWPSSPIRTGGGTRGADVLSYPAGQYPASFLARGFRIVIAPDFTSAELVASTLGSTVLSFSGGAGTDRLALSFAAGNASVYVRDSVVGTQATGTKTWARGSLLTIDVYPSLGRVVSSGFLTGNGTANITPWSWPAGTLYVGTALGGATDPFFGRIGQSVVAL
jgi:hypothetical protein